MTHTKDGFPLTEEQAAVINSKIVPGTIKKVVAGAGTGKSTVLESFAENNPGTEFLYLAFNRSVREKAKKSFPSNVECATFNSLAYKLYGDEYQKSGGILNGISFRSVCYQFKVNLRVAASIRVTLENFLNSAAAEISQGHLFIHPKIEDGAGVGGAILDCAKELWKIMIKGESKWLRMTQSGLLKLLHLREPELGVQCILCDESQDTNPVSMAILEKERSRNVAIVVVGDPRQQIYSWRGAIDAMQGLDCESFNLTASFRFSKRVAWMANKLLKTYRISMFDLVGASGTQDHLYPLKVPPALKNGTHAYLSRTNVGAFEGMVNLIEDGETVAFNGDVGTFIGAITDIFALKEGRMGDVSRFGKCKSMKEYQDLLDLCEVDPELNSLKNIVEKFGIRIPEMLQQINDGLVRDVKFASVLVSTTHKAKGMEYDCVTMADDFPELVRDKKLLNIRSDSLQKNGDVVEQEDLHIMYVAITRAKRVLAIPQNLVDFLDLLRENPSPEFYVPPVETRSRSKDFIRDFLNEDMFGGEIANSLRDEY